MTATFRTVNTPATFKAKFVFFYSCYDETSFNGLKWCISNKTVQ